MSWWHNFLFFFKESKMSFRTMHERTWGRTGLLWVMADKGLGQDSLKYWREAKCLLKGDRISLEIFRKKKVHKMAVFQIQLWNFLFDQALKKTKPSWPQKIPSEQWPRPIQSGRIHVIECLLCELISPLSHLILTITKIPSLFCRKAK